MDLGLAQTVSPTRVGLARGPLSPNSPLAPRESRGRRPLRLGLMLFDTNVLLDIATADPVWLSWSETQFLSASSRGAVLINPIIYAEPAPAFAGAENTDVAISSGDMEK